MKRSPGLLAAAAAAVLGLAWLPRASAEPPPAAALWNADRSAAAASMPAATGAGLFVFLRQDDGSFRSIDASRVEDANLGKLGRARSEFERIETRPVRWLPRSGGLFRITVQTRAWRQGRRETVEELLVLRPDGTVLWR